MPSAEIAAFPRHRHEGREPQWMAAHALLTVRTVRPLEMVDVTDSVAECVRTSRLGDGTATLVTRHTTTGLLINEHEPLLLEDLAAMFERLAPASLEYGHDDFTRRTVNMMPGERRNAPAHCRAALLRTSESLPVVGGTLCLGRWQRVFFVDFDGGQLRELWVTTAGMRCPG